MRHPQYTMTPADVDRHAAQLCEAALQLRSHGPQCRAGVLLRILFSAAARLTSIAAACRDLDDAPSDQAVSDALVATLPPFSELQRRLNHALAGDLPRAVLRRRQPRAIDLVAVAYHSRHHWDETEIDRSQPQPGTSHFHAYATASVIRTGCRFTVALRPVRTGDRRDDVIRALLRQAARVGVRPRSRLLDRGFSSVGVIRSLQTARCPFRMPVPQRGRKLSDRRGPRGTRVFQTWRHSGWSRSTLTDAQRRRATISIGVKCRNYRGQWNRHGRPKLVYGFWGLKPTSPQWVYQTYRQRFGIETSYRQMHQARIRTSTRNPVLRLVYVGVALILRNVWVWAPWELLADRVRGGRKIDLHRLSFDQMLLGLEQLAEEILWLYAMVNSEHHR